MKTLFLVSIADQIQAQMHDWKGLLVMIFIGGVAGLLAEFLVGSKGFGMLVTIIIGIIGGWIGTVLFGDYLNFFPNPLINTIIKATAGAMVLVIVLSLIFRLREREQENKSRHENVVPGAGHPSPTQEACLYCCLIIKLVSVCASSAI